MNKEFYYALDRKNLKANRRIEALVNLLGLQNRDIMCQGNEKTYIDWDIVNQKLESARTKSRYFLENAIERSKSDASSS